MQESVRTQRAYGEATNRHRRGLGAAYGEQARGAASTTGSLLGGGRQDRDQRRQQPVWTSESLLVSFRTSDGTCLTGVYQALAERGNSSATSTTRAIAVIHALTVDGA